MTLQRETDDSINNEPYRNVNDYMTLQRETDDSINNSAYLN